MKWISIEDRLPENGVCVDAYAAGPQDLEGRLTDVFYNHKSKSWWVNDLKYDVRKTLGVNVTHWMPSPEPPKGD